MINSLKTALAVLRDRDRSRLAMRRLGHLSDRVLRDIGLERGQLSYGRRGLDPRA